MKKMCPSCGTEFDSVKKHGYERKFCSPACSNRRTFTDESKWNKSIKLKQWYAALSTEEKIEYANKRCEGNTKYLLSIGKTKKEKFIKKKEKLFSEFGADLRRKIVINEQNETCNRCNLSKWLGQKIVLELDHKDGNNKNNNRENLEAICPNCHSLTTTWRGRNKIKTKVSDEDLLKALNQHNNIRQALLDVGLSAKGNNYKRAKNLWTVNV